MRARSAPVARPRELRRSSIMNVGRRVDYALRALCYLAAAKIGVVTTGA